MSGDGFDVGTGAAEMVFFTRCFFGVGDSDINEADGFFFGSAARSGDAGDGEAVIGFEDTPHIPGHGSGGAFAHGAVLFQRRF